MKSPPCNIMISEKHVNACRCESKHLRLWCVDWLFRSARQIDLHEASRCSPITQHEGTKTLETYKQRFVVLHGLVATTIVKAEFRHRAIAPNKVARKHLCAFFQRLRRTPHELQVGRVIATSIILINWMKSSTKHNLLDNQCVRRTKIWNRLQRTTAKLAWPNDRTDLNKHWLWFRKQKTKSTNQFASQLLEWHQTAPWCNDDPVSFDRSTAHAISASWHTVFVYHVNVISSSLIMHAPAFGLRAIANHIVPSSVDKLKLSIRDQSFDLEHNKPFEWESKYQGLCVRVLLSPPALEESLFN